MFYLVSQMALSRVCFTAFLSRSALVGQKKVRGTRACSHLSIGTNLGSLLILLLRGNGPVHQEQVDIVELEALEGVLDGPENVVVAVKVVPDLGGYEDV